MEEIRITEYTPIRSLLNIAVTEYESYHDKYIKIMVKDAIFLSENNEYRFKANRRVYKFSSYLSVNSIDIIKSMKPDHLTLDNYKTLFEIFKSL